MTRTDLLIPTSFLVLLLIAPVAGRAAEPEGEPGAEPCSADVEKLCKDVRSGRVAACLRAHEAELTSECKQAFAAAREKAEAVKKACRADALKLCKGVRPGAGRILACLRAHDAELSQECKAEMAK